MTPTFAIRALCGREAKDLVPALADILIDCVEGGASVSFMAPLTRARAEAFWRSVAEGVEGGRRVLLVAEDRPQSRPVGTVQLILAEPENQPHRADVAKMLVLRQARRRGIGAALMQAVEEEARARDRSLLVLDTATGSDAERLYARAGWQRVGVIPNYALWPEGGFCSTTLFYRDLAA
jgi:GNAT superfamily N-acetyltransferase